MVSIYSSWNPCRSVAGNLDVIGARHLPLPARTEPFRIRSRRSCQEVATRPCSQHMPQLFLFVFDAKVPRAVNIGTTSSTYCTGYVYPPFRSLYKLMSPSDLEGMQLASLNESVSTVYSSTPLCSTVVLVQYNACLAHRCSGRLMVPAAG